MTTKIYVDNCWFENKTDAAPLDLVAAHQSDIPDDQKAGEFGSCYTAFSFVNSLEDAELEIVPFDLTICVNHNLMEMVWERYEAVEKAGKKLALWAYGDEKISSGLHKPNLMTFSNLGFQSKRHPLEFCKPYYVEDPLPLYLNNELQTIPKSKKAKVGFCGRGIVTASRVGWQLVRNSKRSLQSKLGLTPYAPPDIWSEVYFRGQLLNKLEKSERVDSNFVLSERFLAGLKIEVANDNPHHPIRLQFIKNVNESDYTLCMRGSGNWSIRFYETLSMGRIPLYINTDGILPFDFKINWQDYIVIIEPHELPYIDEKVADFHAEISEDEFTERQLGCRNLWESYLTREGFYAHFRDHLELQPLKLVN